MRAADHIVDLGPGAGEHGGNIVFEGSLRKLVANGNQSLTAKYLRGEMKVSAQRERREVNPKKILRFSGARVHNLKNVEVEVPGVRHDGGGHGRFGFRQIHAGARHDFSLARSPAQGRREQVRTDAFRRCGRTRRDLPHRVQESRRGGPITNVVMIDQSPIGRTPRSNPVTYIKAFDIIRGLFCPTREAEKRGYTAGHFSFNVPGGRCETCQGDGTVTVEMQFLADVELTCDECKGTRYKSGIRNPP